MAEFETTSVNLQAHAPFTLSISLLTYNILQVTSQELFIPQSYLPSLTLPCDVCFSCAHTFHELMMVDKS